MSQTRLAKALDEAGAVIVRQKNHTVYKLPGGKTFVQPKTSGDRRAAANGLSTLNKILREDQPVQVVPPPDIIIEASTAVIAAPPIAPPEPEPLPPAAKTLRDRLEEHAITARRIASELLESVDHAEKRASRFEAILKLVDEQGLEVFEGMLKEVLPQAPAPKPAPPTTERVQVTRQIVLAAARDLTDTYTLDNILDKMLEGHKVDEPERRRIRACVNSSVMALISAGSIQKVQEGRGKTSALYSNPEVRTA